MKTLKQIAEELIEIIEPSNIFETNEHGWETYIALCGSHVSHGYFDIYFRSYRGKDEIEIAKPTEKPEFFIKLIKAIEPKVKITYTRTITEEETV